jgi:hypothetical protein
VWKAYTLDEPTKHVPICKKANDPDSCYHCWASCKLVSECNVPSAAVAAAGIAIEIGGRHRKDSPWDLLADAAGLACAKSGIDCGCCCFETAGGFPKT